MLNFNEWLTNADLITRLRLIETYYTFDAGQYNQVFRDELEKVIQRTSDPVQRKSLERLHDFDWVSYIAGAIRRIYRDYRQGQEAISDVVSKLLMGKLFRGFSPSSPTEDAGDYLLARFKTSIANSIRNMTSKEANRRRYLPTTAIHQGFEPGAIAADDLPARSSSAHDDDKVIEDFRELVRTRLGHLAATVFDLRMAGGETKSLIGSPSVGSPGRFVIKRVVQQIKALAREYAERRGDAAFLREIERAMEREEETVKIEIEDDGGSAGRLKSTHLFADLFPGRLPMGRGGQVERRKPPFTGDSPLFNPIRSWSCSMGGSQGKLVQ